ncbi:hypothetical protein EJB05_14186, partial [Eragrostis curvula]
MAPPRRPRSLPELMDDLIGEILLRVPPDEPSHLIRATLVCKPWRRILFDPVFLRRYREFHRTPPLLGFLRFDYNETKFISTITTSPFSMLEEFHLGLWSLWRTLDCRHGRVLYYSIDDVGFRQDLLLWDPIPGAQQCFSMPISSTICSAAVLCVADRCNHFDCHGGPFRVVFAGTDEDSVSWLSEYSSVAGAWSALTSVDFSASNKVASDSYIDMRPSLFTGDAVYFFIQDGKAILRYDLGQKGQSVLDTSDLCVNTGSLMMAEDGGLGFAGVKDYILSLWSWKANAKGIAGWVQLRNYAKVIGFVEGTNTIVISTHAYTFTLEIKSRQVRKVTHGLGDIVVLSYTSFYAPVTR